MRPMGCAAAVVVGLLFVSSAATAQTPADAPPAARAAAPVPLSSSLPTTIPIFPLSDVVLFPNVTLKARIVEPRYREMVADALEGNAIIGIVLLEPGYEANYEGRPPVHLIGCAGLITNAIRMGDGQYNIELRGLMKFRVMAEDEGRPYRLARVEVMPEESTDDEKTAIREERPRLEAALASFAGRPGTDLQVPSAISDEDLVNSLSQFLRFDGPEHQALLEQAGVLSRSHALIELLKLKAGIPR